MNIKERLQQQLGKEFHKVVTAKFIMDFKHYTAVSR